MNTMGQIISTRRKELGMTQKDLAAKMNVTDKAVSKWERDLAYPDINSLTRLAEVLEVSVAELMNAQEEEKTKEAPMGRMWKETADLILRVVPVAMGVAVAALSAMQRLEANAGLGMLGIGLFCLAVRNLSEQE